MCTGRGGRAKGREKSLQRIYRIVGTLRDLAHALTVRRIHVGPRYVYALNARTLSIHHTHTQHAPNIYTCRHEGRERDTPCMYQRQTPPRKESALMQTTILFNTPMMIDSIFQSASVIGFQERGNIHNTVLVRIDVNPTRPTSSALPTAPNTQPSPSTRTAPFTPPQVRAFPSPKHRIK